MARATWHGVTLAESGDTVIVEGNHYFPPSSIDTRYFRPSELSTVCPWKGEAAYYHIEVDGEVNQDAAWHYGDPKPAAEEIKGRIAFWKGVTVEG